MAGDPESVALNRYSRIIERIFLSNYQEGATEVAFERAEIARVAAELGIVLPKNLGDVLLIAESPEDDYAKSWTG
jgi:hypothetical protein